MSRLPVILLSGFEPFGGDVVNPSWEIAARLDGETVTDEAGTPLARVRSVRLPCVFGEALEALDAALARHRPGAVLALGLDASRTDVAVERVALNIDDARIPDNRGRQPVDQPVCPGAPAAYWSGLPVKAIVRALNEAGVPASVSNSAGSFVCNHVFFGLAHRLAGGSGSSAAVPGGFIHVPWPADEPARGPERGPASAPDHDAAVPAAPAVRSRMALAALVDAIRIALRVTLCGGTSGTGPSGAGPAAGPTAGCRNP